MFFVFFFLVDGGGWGDPLVAAVSPVASCACWVSPQPRQVQQGCHHSDAV